MTRSKKDVEKGLRRKGFVEQDGDHHFFIYHTLGGQESHVFTKTSHSPKYKNLSSDLIGKMAHQCKLNKKQFLGLVDCPLSRETYEEILTELGDLDQS